MIKYVKAVRWYSSDKGKPLPQVLLRKTRTFIRMLMGIPRPLVRERVLDREVIVRDGTVKADPDEDYAWLLACSLRSEVIFDVGANVGQRALIELLAGNVKQLVLIEANPEALIIAAENLIRNQLSANVCFVSAFVGDVPNSRVKFFTLSTAAASSIYQSNFRRIADSSFIEVATTTIDFLCDFYKAIPDLVKIDAEGAEHKVLVGSRKCASHKRTRFLVEMHQNRDISMEVNAANVIEWCAAAGYQAWYLAEQIRLNRPEQIRHRSRCHLLLQPHGWPYPEWLENISEAAALEAALQSI
jgi:FkbM family methyltransferase